MPTELQWIARSSTAAWYWLDVAERSDADAPVPHDHGLAEARQAWQQFLVAQDLGWQAVSEVVLPLSAEFDSPAVLARAMLPRLMPRERAKAGESAWLNALRAWEHAMAAAQPKLGEELQLRIGPIRELAESCLPGLLRMVGRASDPLLLPGLARIVVVPPYCHGYARSFPINNTILWEGLLVNVQPQLPEVLRLCWSVAQLNLEVPALVGEIPRAAACAAGAWATIPLTLHSGSELDQCGCDLPYVKLAAETWQPPRWRELSIEETSAIVWLWWETYAVARPAWPIALAALIAMLDAPRE
jgi:hypothetical protein